jgi:hypothetical protein
VVIKSRRIRWTERVGCMERMKNMHKYLSENLYVRDNFGEPDVYGRNAYEILVGKPEGRDH